MLSNELIKNVLNNNFLLNNGRQKFYFNGHGHPWVGNEC